MGDVIEISLSPQLESKLSYPSSCRKRDPLSILDANKGAIELIGPTDDQSSTLFKRVKRRKEAAETSAGTSTSLDVPAVPSLSLRCGTMSSSCFLLC